MATITVSSNPSTTGDTLTVNFTTDATNISDILISKDGGSTYESATSFTNSKAVFNVSKWSNGSYSNCKLKCVYTETSSGGGTGSGDSEITTESGTFGALLSSASTWYVIGDSISDTNLLPQTKYMTVLGNKFNNLTINNVGKDGSHFTNKTTGYSTFATLLGKLPSNEPNVITIFGGVNDYIQSCTIGDISSTDTSNFYGALNSFVAALNSKYVNAKKLFIIPLNMRAGVFSTNSNGTNSLGNTLQQYRDAIIAVCNANNIEYIDLHEDVELQPDLISSDGLHPTQDGHKLLASKLSKCKITSGSVTPPAPSETYTVAESGNFSTVGKCEGVQVDSSGNLVASTLGQWGMVKLDKTVSKLKFTVRDSVADYGALCWYIYNDNGDGTYNMIALGNTSAGENGKRFKMTIPGTGATQIDKLEMNTINPGETLTIEINGNTQTVYRQDGSKLVTLTGNMSGWCGQSSNSSPFCSNIQYISGSSTAETLTISNIGNITQTEKTEFYIDYSTNIAVAKHEVSWDGGNTFYDKTTDVESSGTRYRFKHDNGGSAGTYQMAIRVTTAKGTTKTSNIFTVTLVNNSGLSFTQYKKLDNGVVTDTTDAKYYSTINKIPVTSSAKYTLDMNPVSYVCVCFYNSSDTYLGNDSGGYIENNTSDWSVGSLSTTFTVPASASYIRICGTSDNTQVTGTLTKSSSGTTTGGLLDNDGAYVIDDFSSNTIDSNKWSYELGYVRNNETQKYTNTNAEVNDGILALRGLKASDGSWTSASIISKGHFAFMYGKIVARVRACNLNGAFGAFWTLGDSFEFGYKENGNPDTLGEWWAYCGEFDVMEFYNGKLTCGAFFNEKEESGRVWYNNYPTGDWHEFAMEWKTDGTLIFSIDGHELSRTSATDNRAFHIPHFILLNQAIGASGGTPDSSTTEITQYVDWVKYYPLSTDNVVLNSSDFSLTAMDANDSSHNCMVRPTFNDNCINKSLTWESSNSSLVWVHSGLCSTNADANGEVTITATSHSGVSKQITLTVTNGVLRAKDSGGTTPEPEPGTIGNMTYGKGIDQSTHIITDNAECWATVNPVAVEKGATYTLQMDATWVWGYAFDDSDNYVSELFTSTGNNNYTYTFTAPTTKIRYGGYDPGKYLTYCKLTKTSGGSSGGDDP